MSPDFSCQFTLSQRCSLLFQEDDVTRDDVSKRKSRDDTDGEPTRQNIFDILGNSVDENAAASDPQKHISKLKTVNSELKGRIRDLEARALRSPATTTASKFKDKVTVRALEDKLQRFERINEDLLLRLRAFEEREGVAAATKKQSPPRSPPPAAERKPAAVDTLFKHGKLTFSPAGKTNSQYDAN